MTQMRVPLVSALNQALARALVALVWYCPCSPFSRDVVTEYQNTLAANTANTTLMPSLDFSRNSTLQGEASIATPVDLLQLQVRSCAISLGHGLNGSDRLTNLWYALDRYVVCKAELIFS